MVKTLLKGLAVILPAVVILITVYWLMYSLEAFLARIYLIVFPDRIYFPGLGLITGLFIAFMTGLSMTSKRAQSLFNHWENALKKIPIVKSLYGMVQDFVELFSVDNKRKYNQVVMMSLKGMDIRLVGFVTREDFKSIELGEDLENSVAVYLPMSYQIGGYLVVVPRSSVEPVNMSLEEATRFIFTAAMSAQPKNGTPSDKINKTEKMGS